MGLSRSLQVPILLDTEEDIVFQGIDQAVYRDCPGIWANRVFRGKFNQRICGAYYAFPSVTIAGQPIELLVVLPPSDGVAFETRSGTIDLSDAVIDLTGVFRE